MKVYEYWSNYVSTMFNKLLQYFLVWAHLLHRLDNIIPILYTSNLINHNNTQRHWRTTHTKTTAVIWYQKSFTFWALCNNTCFKAVFQYLNLFQKAIFSECRQAVFIVEVHNRWFWKPNLNFNKYWKLTLITWIKYYGP